MERKTAHDFDQDLLILFDAYVHGIIDRRSFLDQASKWAVGGVTAAMLLDQLSPKFAEAQQVPRDDARIAPLPQRPVVQPDPGQDLDAILVPRERHGGRRQAAGRCRPAAA